MGGMTANASQDGLDRPSISIIVPVYNVEPYLRECLDSVVNQTLREIEIVCVDDASTDGSPAILKEYAAKDERIRVISFPENRSLSQARKDGVLAATGEYILFLDADDYLDRRACEILLEQMEKHRVDILHFGTRVINAGRSTDRRIESIRDYTRPHGGRLEGNEVFEGFFCKGLYHHTLWNKMYTSELCRRAFALVEDGSFPKAQDLYAFTLLAYFARTYQGLPDVDLIHYRFGSGVTGQSRMSFSNFQRFCQQSKVPPAIRRFLEGQGVWDEYRGDFGRMRDKLLGDCVWNWSTYLVAEDQALGFDLLVEQWGAVETVSAMAREGWNQRSKMAQALAGARALACRKASIRTVGTYYQKISNGGVQRVLCSLIPMWKGMGYEVVLFTDEPPSPDDYPLPEGVKRVVLPPRAESEGEQYGARARLLAEALEEHGVDTMVYHAWLANTLLWDLLVVKSLGIPFAVNTHSVFSCMILSGNAYFPEVPAIYGLCDAVVSLSRVDRQFWSHFAPRAFYLPNPLTFDVEKVARAKLASRDVLWVGRFSAEKRPLDAIQIMAEVVRSVPDARLRMLGSGPNEELNGQIRREIEDSGLSGSVELCGYHPEVEPFYEAASVYLSTSRYEGFPMGLVESKSHGVPCVMYELPYIEMCRGGEGIAAVKQRDIHAAAAAVIALLADDEYRVRMGDAARRSLQPFADADLAGGWQEVLEAMVSGAPLSAGAEVDETERIMMETLMTHYRQGCRLFHLREDKLARCKQDREALKEKVRKTRQELKLSRQKLSKVVRQEKALRNSWSYRLGRAMLYIPGLLLKAARKARGGERR